MLVSQSSKTCWASRGCTWASSQCVPDIFSSKLDEWGRTGEWWHGWSVGGWRDGVAGMRVCCSPPPPTCQLLLCAYTHAARCRVSTSDQGGRGLPGAERAVELCARWSPEAAAAAWCCSAGRAFTAVGGAGDAGRSVRDVMVMWLAS
jgi:hypothetical protein